MRQNFWNCYENRWVVLWLHVKWIFWFKHSFLYLKVGVVPVYHIIKSQITFMKYPNYNQIWDMCRLCILLWFSQHLSAILDCHLCPAMLSCTVLTYTIHYSSKWKWEKHVTNMFFFFVQCCQLCDCICIMLMIMMMWMMMMTMVIINNIVIIHHPPSGSFLYIIPSWESYLLHLFLKLVCAI